MSEKDKQPAVMVVMEEIIKRHNMIEAKKRMNKSYGLAMYDNGMAVKILKNFDFVAENWKLLKQARALGNKELVSTILTQNTDGGIIDTGDVMLDLNRIAIMYPVHRSVEGGELNEEIDELYERDDEINEYLYGRDDDEDEDDDDE